VFRPHEVSGRLPHHEFFDFPQLNHPFPLLFAASAFCSKKIKTVSTFGQHNILARAISPQSTTYRL
jgi:hypothetical protein